MRGDPKGSRVRTLVRLAALAALLGLAAIGYSAWVFWLVPYGSQPFPRQVEIPLGKSVRDAAFILEQQGLVLNARAFLALAYIHGGLSRVKAGIYRVERPSSALELLRKLAGGDVELQRVTVPEGWDLARLADRLGTLGLADPQNFLKLARDPRWASELTGFRVPSLEGFLFPDTYLFPPGVAEAAIQRAMVRRFHQAFDAQLLSRAWEMGWSMLEVVTLASLIEKETSTPHERALISAVFHKRLKLGMRLESDPSVIYGLEGFNGDLRRQDLSVPHAYNTYVFPGLPPGPICSPGQAAIEAALFPAQMDYLYFVSRNDGTHHFSHTLREHLQAVARYQKRARP